MTPTYTQTSLNRHLAPIVAALTRELPFIQRSYGCLPIERLTLTGEKKEPLKRLPLALLSPESGQYEKVTPDENRGGLLFFVETGDARTPRWEVGSRSVDTVQPLALLLWGRLEDIKHQPDHVQRTCLKVLRDYPEFIVTGHATQLQDRVFRELDYDFQNHRYLMHPFFGLRIEGTLNYSETLCN